MNVRRILAGAVVASAALAPAAQAQYIIPPIIQDTQDGCYGVGVAVCDPSISSRPYTTSSVKVPVCAGTCTDVSVPIVKPNGQPLCVSYEDRNGTAQDICS
jgi:uncharacterized membrane protein